MSTTIHICTGGPKLEFRGIDYCYRCKKRTRWTGYFQAWYGLTTSCCRCGETTADGYVIGKASGRRAHEAKEKWATSLPWRSREARRRISDLYDY